jgi:hypothetical protein
MSLGLSKQESSDITTLISKYVRCNGEEWTVQKLKDVKQLFAHRLAGSANEFVPNIWLALDDHGLPKGALKPLFRRGASKRNFSKVLTALNAHTSFVSSCMTEKQRTKFFESMESPVSTGLTSTPRQGLNPEWFAQQQRKIGVRPMTADSRVPPTFIEYLGNRRGPSGRNTGLSSASEEDTYGMFLHGARSYQVRKIVDEFREHFDDVLPSFDFFNQTPFPTNNGTAHNVGYISVIQEPGFKARLIANPSRVLQAALEPLKEDISNALLVIPTDVTHDQFSAVRPIQSWLQDGKTVYSIDLSDATNLFPWQYQKGCLLRHFTGKRQRTMIEIMDRVSKSEWATNLKTGQWQKVSFSRGQPQGLGPSFAAFAFTHNLLLAGICHKVKVKPRDTFRVLGDDVVINNGEVARRYRATLNNLGCKVSESKTFASNRFAEFAGYTITPNSYGKAYKWKSVSDRSFLDFVRNLGPRSIGYLNPAQRSVAKVLLKGHKALGGLGVGPGSLDDYLIKVLNNKDQENDMVVGFRDLYHECLNFVNSIPGPPPPTWVPHWYEEGVKRKAFDLLDYWQSSRLKDLRETYVSRDPSVPLSGRVLVGKVKPNMYLVRQRDGDPRSSNINYIRSLLQVALDDPLLCENRSGLAKFITSLKHLSRMNAKSDSYKQTKKKVVKRSKGSDRSM